MRKNNLSICIITFFILIIAIDCNAFTRKLTIRTNSRGVAADLKGNIYSTYMTSLEKYNKNGVLVDKIDASASVVGYDNMVFFNGITIGPDGNIYVSVSTTSGNGVRKYTPNLSLLLEFGSTGNGDGQLYQNHGVVVDRSGNIFVADAGNNRIQKFDSNGNFISKWGVYGNNDNEFLHIRSISMDSAGNVYVADGNSDGTKFQKFSNSGKFIYSWRESPDVNDGRLKKIKSNYIVRAPSGLFLMVGSNWYQKYSSNRTLLDQVALDDSSYGTSGTPFIANDGSIYAIGDDHIFVYDWDMGIGKNISPVINSLLLNQ